MKADPNLIASFSRIGKAMKGIDMQEYYKAWGEMQGNFYTSIKSVFDKKQVETEAIMGKINDPIEKILTDIANDGTVGSEKQYDAASAMLEQWKEEYRDAVNSGDKKAQHKLMGKVNNMSQQNMQLETDLMTIGQLVNAGEINTGITDPSTLAAIEKLIDFDNGNPDVTYSYDDAGNLTYVINTENTEYGDNGFVTVSAKDIKKLVIPFAHEAESKYNDILKGNMTSGSTKGGKFDYENTKYLISRTVLNTEQAFADLVTRKFGRNKESFRDALIKDPNLQKILMELDSSYDVNQSGGIDDELAQNTDGTFVNDANATAIIDALTNPNAKDGNGMSMFDFRIAKELASHWFAGKNEDAFNEYGGGKGVAEGGSGSYKFDKPEIYGAYRSKKDIDDMNKAIKNKQSFIIGFDNKKYIYNPKTNKYEFGEEAYSPDDLRILQKIHGYRAGKDPKPQSEINKEKAAIVGTTIKPGEYEPFEREDDGNLVSDQNLKIVGINSDGSYKVQDEKGETFNMPKPKP